MHKRLFRLRYLVLLLFAWSLPAHAQHATQSPRPQSLSYGFVSPNTREGLKLEDAIRNLHSPEQEKLIRSARGLSCVSQSKITALKGIGSWTDGAEQSVLLRTQTDRSTLRYVVSLLGKNARQKAVLYFHSDSLGSAEMYSLQTRNKPLSHIAQLLNSSGIEFRTLIPTKKAVLIYIVDLKRELRAKVTSLARKLKTRFVARRGLAEFIGDDMDRDKAAAVFNQQITDYESKYAGRINLCRQSQNSSLRYRDAGLKSHN